MGEEIEEEENAAKELEGQRQEERGRGNRSREDVTYQEQLSERDWLKAIGAEDEGSSDDNKYAELDDTPSKKKKRRDYEEEEPVKKRKKGNKKLCKKMKKLIEVVMQYEDSDGRVLSEPFYKLPSRKELPDYYEIIKRPVDIAKIQQRIDDEKYDDMSALQKDFMLLCTNTQQYNEDGSLIFEDSIVLQSVFTNARERLEQEPDEPDDDEEEMMDQDEESRMSMGSTSSKKSKKKKKRVVESDDDDDD